MRLLHIGDDHYCPGTHRQQSQADRVRRTHRAKRQSLSLRDAHSNHSRRIARDRLGRPAMNALVKMTRRQILGTTGFLSLAFVMPSKIFAQEAPESIGKADGPGLPHDMIKNPMLSSWLRINSNGTVTLLIGKVELGQGNRTAIAQVCAEELGVDFGRLQIIAGDTKLCPDEGVTSGSSSMPDGATAVKYASAEVREILFGLAATKLGQPAETMKVKDGIITAANGKTATYWDLVIGKALDVKATDNPKVK